MPTKKKILHYTEPLFDDMKKDYCYVCGKRIKNNDGINVGNNVWRHKVCRPGSAHWMLSAVSKEESVFPVYKS